MGAGEHKGRKTLASDSEPWGSFCIWWIKTCCLTNVRLVYSLSPLIAEIWSYLSVHILVFPPRLNLSQQGSWLIRSECRIFQSSGILSSLSQCTLPTSTFLWKVIEDNTQCSPVSFPIVSLPISPSETSLPFGSPVFKLKRTARVLLVLYPASLRSPAI